MLWGQRYISFFCLQCGRVSDLIFLHPCLCLSVTGLCPPLEKRLLPITVHSSTWLLLHHSSHPPGPDQTAHPLLRRYSRGLRRGERSARKHAGLSLISWSRLMKRMKGNFEGLPLGIALLISVPKEGTLMTLCISWPTVHITFAVWVEITVEKKKTKNKKWGWTAMEIYAGLSNHGEINFIACSKHLRSFGGMSGQGENLKLFMLRHDGWFRSLRSFVHTLNIRWSSATELRNRIKRSSFSHFSENGKR